MAMKHINAFVKKQPQLLDVWIAHDNFPKEVTRLRKTLEKMGMVVGEEYMDYSPKNARETHYIVKN